MGLESVIFWNQLPILPWVMEARSHKFSTATTPSCQHRNSTCKTELSLDTQAYPYYRKMWLSLPWSTLIWEHSLFFYSSAIFLLITHHPLHSPSTLYTSPSTPVNSPAASILSFSSWTPCPSQPPPPIDITYSVASPHPMEIILPTMSASIQICSPENPPSMIPGLLVLLWHSPYPFSPMQPGPCPTNI